jgi:hypothetical protein
MATHDEYQPPPKNGLGFVLILFGAAVILLGVLVARGFDRLEQATGEAREGRLLAMALIARDHRDVLCMLAMDQAERKLAIQSGDVCGYVLGNLHREGGAK